MNFITDNRWKLIVRGLGETVKITLCSVVLGVILGIIVATICSAYTQNRETMKRKGGIGYHILKFLNAVCNVYLAIIRGTPTVVQLLIGYFIIWASSTNELFVASMVFGLNSGAYVAEIFRSGIMSVDGGQFEAGRSLGFSYPQTMLHVIIPQAFKNCLPSLGNEAITLFKETSIAGYVGICDLTKAGDMIRTRTYSAFMPLIAVALIYLVICLVLTAIQHKIERRLRKSDR